MAMIPIIQVWSVIYVKNRTNEFIKDIYFTLDDYERKDPKIKKIKSAAIQTTSIDCRGYSGVKSLYLYHFDKNNSKRQYLICEDIKSGYCGNIKVTIKDVKEDGSLDFDVIMDYDPNKTH